MFYIFIAMKSNCNVVLSLYLILFLCHAEIGISIAENEEIVGIDTTHIKKRKIETEYVQQDRFHINPASSYAENVHLLAPGTEKLLLSSGRNRLEIFCYSGEPQNLLTVLKTVELLVQVPQDNFKYYEGNSFTSVQLQHDASTWLSFTPWKPRSFRLGIYNFSCIGIETHETIKVFLKVRYFDVWRVLLLALGVVLFLTAPLLAHNVMFHYVTGISVGIVGSLLVIVFVLSRYLPKKSGALTFLIGGWGLVVYILQYLWSNCILIIKEYQAVAAGYVAVAGIVSFCVVYRWGPVQDIRSLKLVQWSLQVAGLSAVFVSSQYKEFSLSLVLILLASHNFPVAWKTKIKTYWLRHFPPKQRLLTEDEYLQQGREETKNGLEELREFCHSPNCNAWTTMLKLNTPYRFAEFVEGGSHLTDEEILSYESTNYHHWTGRTEEELLTSDEDEEETDNI